MKETLEEKMEKEIAVKKKLPQEIKDEMNKKVFYNLLFAIAIVIYFIFLNLGFYNIDKTIFTQDTHVFAMVILLLSILLFEKAYQKEKGNLAIHGLEVLAVALLTLFTPYTYFYIEPVASKILMMVPLAFAIYYVAKGAILCASMQTKYEANLSDVKEIVKKEPRKLDETIEMDKDKEAEQVEKTRKSIEKKKKVAQKEDEPEKQESKKKVIKKTETKKTTATKTKAKKEETAPKKTSAKKVATEKEATKKTTRKRTSKEDK